MARIRTIKPEMPQSENLGRTSRDARLLFIMLFTLADDEGRTRAAPRMLAGLLFPYDDDAPSKIGTWLDELEKEQCIIRYAIEDTSYLQIKKWEKHQKIDKPSKSRIPPPPDGCSRTLANVREPSATDLGPRTVDQGPRIEFLHATASPSPKRRLATRWPEGEKVSEEWKEKVLARMLKAGLTVPNLELEAERFASYWSSQSGQRATKVNWFLTFYNWCLNARIETGNSNRNRRTGFDALTEGARRAIASFDQMPEVGKAGTIEQLGLADMPLARA